MYHNSEEEGTTCQLHIDCHRTPHLSSPSRRHTINLPPHISLRSRVDVIASKAAQLQHRQLRSLFLPLSPSLDNCIIPLPPPPPPPPRIAVRLSYPDSISSYIYANTTAQLHFRLLRAFSCSIHTSRCLQSSKSPTSRADYSLCRIDYP